MQPVPRPALVALACLIAPCCLAAQAGPKMVFAHYMVCIPRAGGDATVEDYMAEMREAQAAGIDGFALNCGGWSLTEPHYKARTTLLYEAARRLGTGFQLFLSADYATALTFEETRDMLVSFGGHPNQFRWDGKPVLSTFAGEGADNAHGRELIAFLDREFPDGKGGHDVCFVPYFYPRPNITELPTAEHAEQVLSDFPGLDGFFYFGAAGTGERLAESNALLADKWVGEGRVFMASVTPYYRGFGGNYRVYETRGLEAMAREWEAAIAHDATWVEIVTWNDWGEASYIAPYCPDPRSTEHWGGHWGAMLSHAGYLEATRYYAEWFKTGTPPEIERDRLCYFHRLHPMALEGRVKPGEETLGRPGGADELRDSLFVSSFLTAPASLQVLSGESVSRFELPAGVCHTEVPFALGAQRLLLTRDGRAVIDKTSEHEVGTDTSTDFNIFAGSAVAE